MKVILTQKVKNLGGAGEIVNVSTGYARNFLIPNGLVLLADSGNTKKMEDYKKRLAKKVGEEKTLAEEIKGRLQGQTVGFIKKAGATGRLFGTLTTNEIATELTKQGFEVERKQIVIENPIKQLGEYSIKAKLFTDVEAQFNVKVEMSEKQKEELKKQIELSAKRKEAEEKRKAEEAAAKEAAEAENDEEVDA